MALRLNKKKVKENDKHIIVSGKRESDVVVNNSVHTNVGNAFDKAYEEKWNKTI
jgi:hypothetical protein